MRLDSTALIQVIIAVVTWFVLGGGILYYLTHKDKPSKGKPPKKLQNKKPPASKKGKQSKSKKNKQNQAKKKRSGSVQSTNKEMKNSLNLKSNIKKSKSSHDVNKLNNCNKIESKHQEENETKLSAQNVGMDSELMYNKKEEDLDNDKIDNDKAKIKRINYDMEPVKNKGNQDTSLSDNEYNKKEEKEMISITNIIDDDLMKSKLASNVKTSLLDMVETKQDMKDSYDSIRQKTVEYQILNQLEIINNKFDGLINAINEINHTLQEQKLNEGEEAQLIHHKTVAVSKCRKCIEMFEFILSLPFQLLFNIKTIAMFVLFTLMIIYIWRKELNNKVGINIDEMGEWITKYYIFPQQTIQRYLVQSVQNINHINEYNKDLNERLNVEINEKWKQYTPIYDEYLSAFKKQLFYSKEKNDESIRQLVLIGVTGTGKSLFGNRLSGYEGNIERNGYFEVSGDVESCTQNISKLIVYNLHSVNISILDTPGIFDTENADIIHQHNLIEYLKGSGGVNAFILLLKKERLSSFIQNMLHELEDKFGDEFWSHLIFVINFWNKRDEIGWDEWKNDFIKKIRKEFGLNDKIKYPFHIVGLNNFGSYRSEIERNLIPNIPVKRLNCKDFKSPLDRLKNETSKLYVKLRWLLNNRRDTKRRLDDKCNELRGVIKDLKWFGNKVTDKQQAQIEQYYTILHTKCESSIDEAEIDEMENGLRNKSILKMNEENINDLLHLETKSIDYDKFILNKLSYLTNSNSQYIVGCIHENMKLWLVNHKLSKGMELLIRKHGTETLWQTEQICNAFVDIEKNVTCCNSNVNKEMYMTDDGLRFLHIKNK